MYLCSSAAVGKGLLPPENTALTASMTLAKAELKYKSWQLDVAFSKLSSSSLFIAGSTPFTYNGAVSGEASAFMVCR